MRSGYIHLTNSGVFVEAGSYGYSWSSHSKSSIVDAYNLWFDEQAVYPSNSNWRAHVFGLPLRWFCRGGVPIFLLGWQEQIIATQLFYALVAAKK